MNRIYIVFLLAGSALFASCDKWADEAYRNPNAPVAVEPELVLPSVHANIARGIQFDARNLAPYTQMMSIALLNTWQDTHGPNPNPINDASGEKWRTHYWNLGHNLLNMINQTKDSKPEFAGVAYALFSLSWLQLADYHGPVILKQAFQTDRLSFDYDEQQEAYQYVIAICDTAELYLKRALADPAASARLATADRYFYNGNIDSYLRFAYGVKALAYHRWWNKTDYKPDSVIKYINLSFTSAAQDASVKFDQAPLVNDQRNFFGPSRNNLASYRASQFVISLFKGEPFGNATDPRLAFIFKPADDGQFRGIEPGRGFGSLTTAQRPHNFWGFNATSSPAGGSDAQARTYFLNSGPFPVLTYAWLQFVKAEAMLKKEDKAGALAAYQAGIRGHFDHLKSLSGYTAITDAARDSYLNNTSVVPANPSELTRSMVMMQKYMALWGYGFEEAWFDLRKDKYSADIFKGWKFPEVFAAANNGKPAYRVRPRYNSEYLWNVDALNKVGGFDADYHTKEVWFVNP